MKRFEVLGSGCANCRKTAELIGQVAAERGVDIDLKKVEDTAAIVAAGVMATPAVIAAGEIVHAGGVPSLRQVEGWF